jgi:hypothetical protein
MALHEIGFEYFVAERPLDPVVGDPEVELFLRGVMRRQVERAEVGCRLGQLEAPVRLPRCGLPAWE